MAFRLRSNLVEDVSSFVHYNDHWDGDRALAVEIKLAKNLTVFFKPCAVIPQVESLDHPLLADQIAPIISTRVDPRTVKKFLTTKREWLDNFEEFTEECAETMPFYHTNVPRVPGCLLYWTPELAEWNQRRYGAKIQNVLSLMHCKNITLNSL